MPDAKCAAALVRTAAAQTVVRCGESVSTVKLLPRFAFGVAVINDVGFLGNTICVFSKPQSGDMDMDMTFPLS